jgi:hypothetical protein
MFDIELIDQIAALGSRSPTVESCKFPSPHVTIILQQIKNLKLIQQTVEYIEILLEFFLVVLYEYLIHKHCLRTIVN